MSPYWKTVMMFGLKVALPITFVSLFFMTLIHIRFDWAAPTISIVCGYVGLIFLELFVLAMYAANVRE